MPERAATVPIACEGGLVTSLDVLRQGRELPGSAIRLVNFEPHPAGGYRRLEGFGKFDPATVPGSGDLLGVHVLAGLGGGVLAFRGTDAYTSSGAGWTQRNGVAVRTAGAYNRFARYGYMGAEKLVVVNGVDRPAGFDPATFTWTVWTNAPMAAGSAVEFKGRLWFGTSNLLTYGSPLLENDFVAGSGAGQINVGSPITALATWRDQLIVFSASKIQKVTGNTTADFQLLPVTAALGCSYPDSVQEVGGDLVFLSHDGLRTVAGSDKFSDTDLSPLSRLAQSEATSLASTYTRLCSLVVRSKAQYRLLTSTSGVPAASTTGLLASLRPPVGAASTADPTGAWEFAQLKGLRATVADSWAPPSGGEEVTVFGESTGYVYRMESGSDFDGTTIEASYQTPFLSFDDPRVRKIFRRLIAYVDAEGDIALRVSLVLDLGREDVVQPIAEDIGSTAAASAYSYSSPGAVYGVATYGATSAVLPTTETLLVGAGFTGSFRFDSDQPCPPFAIKSLAIEMSLGGRK